MIYFHINLAKASYFGIADTLQAARGQMSYATAEDSRSLKPLIMSRESLSRWRTEGGLQVALLAIISFHWSPLKFWIKLSVILAIILYNTACLVSATQYSGFVIEMNNTI